MSMLDFEKHGSQYAVTPCSIRYTADRILKQMEEEFGQKLRELHDVPYEDWDSDESGKWASRLKWVEHLRGQPELVEVGFMLMTELGRNNTALQGMEW